MFSPPDKPVRLMLSCPDELAKASEAACAELSVTNCRGSDRVPPLQLHAFLRW